MLQEKRSIRNLTDFTWHGDLYKNRGNGFASWQGKTLPQVFMSYDRAEELYDQLENKNHHCHIYHDSDFNRPPESNNVAKVLVPQDPFDLPFVRRSELEGNLTMYTPELSPEEVTDFLESGKEKIKAALNQIGATATDDNVESLFDADLETRQQVWSGIFRSMQIGAKTFDDWLQAAEGDVPRDTIDAMKTLHDFLNFEPGSLLKELGIVGVVDDRSDEEIEEASEEWEPILQYRETGATSQFLPKDRNWLFRTSTDRILKETEKAYLVSLDGSPPHHHLDSQIGRHWRRQAPLSHPPRRLPCRGLVWGEKRPKRRPVLSS